MEFSDKKITILIPAYNAEKYLDELIKRIKLVLNDAEIIVVDDGSTDDTFNVAKKYNIIVLRHEKNLGKGSALQTGFNFIRKDSQCDFVITMDADLQHSPEDIPNLINKQTETDADIVIGWRQRIGTGMPLHRILSNTITSFMVGVKTGIRIKDSQCGFRLVRRKVIEQVTIESSGYEAETEFLIKSALLGYKIDFVPVKTIYGNEKSYMTNFKTTINFIKVLFRKYA